MSRPSLRQPHAKCETTKPCNSLLVSVHVINVVLVLVLIPVLVPVLVTTTAVLARVPRAACFNAVLSTGLVVLVNVFIRPLVVEVLRVVLRSAFSSAAAASRATASGSSSS